MVTCSPMLMVAEADTVQVTLKDGRSFEEKVEGTDRVTDVAVVKLKATICQTGQLKKLGARRVGDRYW